jgi:hypothetical protein
MLMPMLDKVGKDCSNISGVKFDAMEIIETFLNRLEPTKASNAMEFMVDGIVMPSNVLHSLNASSSINVVPSLRITIFNEMQL